MSQRHRMHASMLLLALSVSAAATALAQSLAHQQQAAFRRAFETIRPSIVRIETIGGALPVRRAGEGEQQIAAPTFRQADGPTTGVIWSADGEIITSSFNFMRDPSIITVTLADGRHMIARLVARDRAARLALLKVEASDLPAATRVASGAVKPGQWALAAGWGFGGEAPAVSVGVISAVQRIFGLALQTDAKISPANYGGPLFDLDGGLLGICVPLSPEDDEIAGVEWYDSGIGFAVNIDTLQTRVERLRTGFEWRRGYLGLAFDGREAVLGAATDTSAPIEPLRVNGPPSGPAPQAGLREGDVLTHVGEEAVSRLFELRRALARYAAGDRVELTVRRDGALRGHRLTLAARDDLQPPAPPQTQPETPAKPGLGPQSQPSSPPASQPSDGQPALDPPITP